MDELPGTSRAGPQPPPEMASYTVTSPRSLSTIAESELLSMADVAFLSRVATSTLSRLWRDESWLDRVSGATLQQLIAVMPGLGDYVTKRSHGTRLESALRECRETGLDVSPKELASLTTDSRSSQHAATVLTAANCVMRLGPREALTHMARCWGSAQDQALEALFSTNGLLTDPTMLIARALQLIESQDVGNNSLHATVGYGILVYKLTKWTGDMSTNISTSASRRSAFTYRSSVIGLLLGENDFDVAEEYSRSVADNPLLARNELWSLASYCADVQQTADFSLAAKCGLRKTAAEVLLDISSRNHAYLYYLVATAIPVLLDYDPSFGLSRARISRTLRERLECGINDRRTRAVIIKFLSSLK